jgi:hypothetical protein
VQRPGSAERDEREVAWVEPLLDGDDAKRSHHLGVDDVHHRGRVDARERAFRRIAVELDPAGERSGQAPEEEVGVADRRPGASASVAGRAGLGSRALRADAQRAALVESDDRPTACPDGVHRDRGQPDREPAHDSLVLASHGAVDDGAHVRGRPAHVEGESVLEPGERGDASGADDAGGRPREQRERGMRRRLVERRDSAGRAHDQRYGKIRLVACRLEGMQVARENRPEIGVDCRRRGALVLAELRCDLVGRDDVRLRVPPPQLLCDGALVGRVAEGEEQRDSDRVGLDLGQRLERERLELTVGSDPPAHSDAALERDERRRMVRAGPVQVRARLAAQVEDVLEAVVRDERGARAAALEERVRSDGGAVREALDVRRADRRRRGDDGLLLPSGGRDLGGADLSVGDEHGVREGSPDVDPERPHPGIRARRGR